ncbi:polygalacturonase [Actinomyces sp. Z5]|uniref:glycoside hydrolase family 28 protein n=1 Tax=Actinomyces sp. Z5 TaxID=2250216 RepID=UPI000DCC7CFA|nr:glycosyl hydrolase family 28 protein [Actinomyces sp. Z5]RAX24112.1 polygalacturonase [Actinomyces sp. Z5]
MSATFFSRPRLTPLAPLAGLQEARRDPCTVTRAIQGSIDAAAARGGGDVVLSSAGTWLVDGLVLRDHVTLVLGEGVTLKASGDEQRYTRRPGPFELLSHDTPISALIYGKSLTGAGVRGRGRIDASYERFIPPNQGDAPHLRFYDYPRPMTVYLEDCRGPLIKDITIIGAPFWTIHLVGCVNTAVQDVTIRNEMRMPNTDGIDIDRCTNTLIDSCTITTGDDAICAKCTEETARYGLCENLTVRVCVLESQSSAIKFGSSSFGGFANALFERITINRSNRGIAFQLRDPGTARSIVFRDITISTRRFSPEWWGSGEPVHLTLVPRDIGTNLADSCIEGVRFERVQAHSDNAVVIHAAAGRIEHVSFHDCTIQLNRQEGTPSDFDLRPCMGPHTLVAPARPVVTTVGGVSWDGTPVPVIGPRAR